MFNDLFSKTYTRQYLEQQEADIKRKYIENAQKTFCFVFDMKTGFANQTMNGISSSANYKDSQFVRTFNGREGIIAQWQGAVKLDTCYLPEVLTKDNIDKPFGTATHPIESFYTWYKANADKFKSIMDSYFTAKMSYYQDGFGNAYIYDGTDFKKSDGTIIGFGILIESIKNDTTGNVKLFVVDDHKKNMAVYNYYDKWYEKGAYFMVVDSQADDGVSFQSTPGSNYMGDSTQWETVQKVLTYTTQDISKEMLYKLYMIPQKVENEDDDLVLYYINDCTKYYAPDGKLVYSQVEFASINDSLATTGQIIKGTIMFGAPGEGYAIPQLIFNDFGEAKDFTVNEKYTGDQGVRTLQVELLGPGGIAGICAYGRPIEESGKVNKIYPPRRLLLSDLKFAVMDNMTTNSNPESVFVAGVFNPEIQSYFESWKQARSATFTDSIKKSYDGYFDPNTSTDDINTSNPNNMDLRRTDWNLKGNIKATKPLSTVASPYFAALKADGTSYIGSTTIDPNTIDSGRAHDFINFMGMIFEQFPTMPVGNYQTYAWTLSQIPLIGGFLSKITLGIPVGWRDSSYFQSDLQWKGFAMLVSKQLFNWYAQAFWDSSAQNGGRIPLDMFKQDVDDQVGGIINSSAMTTAICGNLTDKINMKTFNITTGEESAQDSMYSTLYNNQRIINDEGVEIRPLITRASGASDATKEAITDLVGNGKYLIDAVEVIAVAKMPCRLTTFSADPDKVSDPFATVNWQTTVQTKSMLTGNVRDIATVFKTSYFDDGYVNPNVNFPFPNNNEGANGGAQAHYDDEDLGELALNEQSATTIDWKGMEALDGKLIIQTGTNAGKTPSQVAGLANLTKGTYSLGKCQTQEPMTTEIHNYSKVILDFKQLGFVDYQQVLYAYGAIEMQGPTCQGKYFGYTTELMRECTYNRKDQVMQGQQYWQDLPKQTFFNSWDDANGLFDNAIDSAYHGNNAINIGAIIVSDTGVIDVDKKNIGYQSIDIADLYKGPYNLIDASVEYTMDENEFGAYVSADITASLYFNVDNLTLEVRGTTQLSKKFFCAIHDYVVGITSVNQRGTDLWDIEFGKTIPINTRAFYGSIASQGDTGSMWLHARDHSNKAIKIESLKIMHEKNTD